jgi:hypothetical protein
LTKEAIEGKVPLRTFGELSALFAAKRDEPAAEKPVEPPRSESDQPTAPPPSAAEPVSPHADAPAPVDSAAVSAPEPPPPDAPVQAQPDLSAPESPPQPPVAGQG